MEQFFFGGWQSLFRTLVVGVLAYVTLLLFLRFSGKRTLSKMNAFDLVVTVAVGSTLATVLLAEDVALAAAHSRSPCWWDCTSWLPGPASGRAGCGNSLLGSR